MGLSKLTNFCGECKENTLKTVAAMEINDSPFPVQGKKTEKKVNYKINRNYGKTSLELSVFFLNTLLPFSLYIVIYLTIIKHNKDTLSLIIIKEDRKSHLNESNARLGDNGLYSRHCISLIEFYRSGTTHTHHVHCRRDCKNPI